VPVLRRLTAYKLAVRGSRMPGAAEGLTLGPDNVYFRSRLRLAHPETESDMRKQRQACVKVCTSALASRAVRLPQLRGNSWRLRSVCRLLTT